MSENSLQCLCCQLTDRCYTTLVHSAFLDPDDAFLGLVIDIVS